MQRLLACLLIAAALAGCAAPSTPDDGPDGADVEPPANATWNWTPAPEPSTARGEAACAVADGSILLVGGFVEGPGNQVTASTELYDVADRSWQAAPDLPIPLHHTHVAAHDGTFYALGGYTGPGFTATDRAFSWSPGDDGWQPIAALPTARGAGGAAVVDDRIVLAGGVGADMSLIAQVDVYNASTDSWTQGPQLPTPRDHLAVDAVGDLVVAATGRQQSFASNTELTEAWNVTGDAWQRVADAPTARGGDGGTAWNGSLVVAGGEESGATFAEVEAYHPGNDSWTELPPTPTARHGLCVASTTAGLHTITGGEEPGFAASDVHEVLVRDGDGDG